MDKKDIDEVKEFAGNIRMALDHDGACDRCLEFLCANGLPLTTVKTLDGTTLDASNLVVFLQSKYKKSEEYEKLARLRDIPLWNGTILDWFVKAAGDVLSLDENMDVCGWVLVGMEMTIFYGLKVEGIQLDLPRFMSIVTDYYHEFGPRSMCPLLDSLHREVSRDFPDGKYVG